MSFTDDQAEVVLNYFSNARDDEGGPNVYVVDSDEFMGCLDDLQTPLDGVDWLDPSIPEDALELEVRPQLIAMSREELRANTLEVFRTWLS